MRETLASALAAALESARADGALELPEAPTPTIDVPPSPEQGDYFTDFAVGVARQARQTPRRVADLLAARMEVPTRVLDRIEVAPSGLLSFRLRTGWVEDLVHSAASAGESFGRSPGAGESVQVEFVSAHPTAPLTPNHGRGAALGDAIASLLEWTGSRVRREFYVNDTGSHVERFGRSLLAGFLRAAGRTVQDPPDALRGTYLDALAAGLWAERGERVLSLPAGEQLAALTQAGLEAMLRRQHATLEHLGVRFDEWYSESALYRSGKLDAAIARLRENGHVEEMEGAVWLRTTRFGDELDRPLRRSNGRTTYLAGDLAYHLEKFRRGFDRVIDVWSADHAGYAERTRAGIAALGCNPDAVEILIFQPVTLRVDELAVELGGPFGNNLTLDEVLERAGSDTARLFYLMRPAASQLDFDLDLAARQDADNPAWALRRTLESARAAGVGEPVAAAGLAGLSDAGPRALMRSLAAFPDELQGAARERDPARLTRYALDTAASCDRCLDRLVVAAAGRTVARAAASVLENSLRVLGLRSTPEQE